jgi:Flp pilus assembly protein TadD
VKLDNNQTLNHAITAHKEGKLDEAERLYLEILKVEPKNGDANHNLGVLKVLMNQSASAIPLFKTAIEVYPDIVQFWFSYGGALINEKKFEEAELTYSKIIKLNPNFVEAYNNLGVSQENLDKLEEAELSFKKAIELKPNYAEAHNSLGFILYNLARYEECEIVYKKAIELRPDYPEAFNNLAIVYYDLGKYDAAEVSYKKAIELRPNYAEAYNNLGNTLNKIGKFEDAVVCLKKAIDLKPKLAEAHNNLAHTLKNLNRFNESEVSYQKYISLNSDFVAIAHHINKGDWKISKNLLDIMCTKKIFDTKRNIKEFIALWCLYCSKLLANGDIKKFSQIFIKLLIIGERNRDLNSLIILFFDKVDIDTALKLVEPHDKILIKVSYCQYKFVNKNFLQSEKLASSNIQDATNFINSIETEDLGWLVVRRSLALYENKNVAREKLNNLLFKLIEIKQ